MGYEKSPRLRGSGVRFLAVGVRAAAPRRAGRATSVHRSVSIRRKWEAQRRRASLSRRPAGSAARRYSGALQVLRSMPPLQPRTASRKQSWCRRRQRATPRTRGAGPLSSSTGDSAPVSSSVFIISRTAPAQEEPPWAASASVSRIWLCRWPRLRASMFF